MTERVFMRYMPLLTILALTGCTVGVLDSGMKSVTLAEGEVLMQMDDISIEDVTKTEAILDEATGLSFNWTEDDKVGVYTQEGGMALYNITAGQGTGQAVFNGSGFSLTEGKTYYALYPYEGNLTDMTKISLDYSTRKIEGQDNTQALAAYDFMSANAVADAGSHANFRFRHLSSFARLVLNFPSKEKINSIDVIPTYDGLAESVTYNLKDDKTSVNSSKTFTNIPVSGVDSDKMTAWLPLIPQELSDAAVVVNTESGRRYSTRLSGKDLKAGKAYRWNLDAPAYPTAPSAGFTLSTLKNNSISSMPSGEYSGITWISGNRYAVVHDKKKGGGIIFFDLSFNSSGSISSSSYKIPAGTDESTVTRDPEGIVYVPKYQTLFVSGEGDQQILEYDMDGRPTGRRLNIPSDMGKSSISSNYGFEALGYNSNTHLFWTTTENVLPKDKSYSIEGGILMRLQSFSDETLEAGKRYLYMMDSPSKTPSSGDTYAYGIPDVLALDDGRLIVMEREAYVPSSYITSNTVIKFYLVDPVNDRGGILSKTLLHTISTSLLGDTWRNYEGICLCPNNGTILIINDSQSRYKSVLFDYITVLKYSK